MKTKINGLDCILLVDDDQFTNYINVKVIQKAKVNTHIQMTTSAEEALDFLREEGRFTDAAGIPKPGIIFLDLNMPGMNGWEFLDEFRTLLEERKARIVLVILTSSNNPMEMEKASLNKDVVAFWTKPLRPEKVVALVDAHFFGHGTPGYN